MPEDQYFQFRNLETLFADGAKARPQRKIIGAFLYEDTTTYLFSRTNYGKSLLVFQFAFAAATGTSFDECPALKNDCPPLRVLVVDLELEARDLLNRHGMCLKLMNPEHRNNLIYLHEKVDNKMVLGFDLLTKIEDAAVSQNSQVVIIDNISRLLPDSLKPELVTMLVSSLNSIRKKTGASILVIGHTTKGNPKVAIQPTDYFGSSMVQNFFAELSFLDTTPDGRFFLCHTKTKHEDSFMNSVPVFNRGTHPVVGIGFNFLAIHPTSEVQLPYNLPQHRPAKRRLCSDYKDALLTLKQSGMNYAQIAEATNFNKSAVFRFFNP